MKPEKGEYGLWYAGTVGFATKEEAQAYIDRGHKSAHEYDAEAVVKRLEAEQRAESIKNYAWLSFALVCALAIAGWIAFGAKSGNGNVAIASEALTSCQRAILSTAKYGDAERPPYRSPSIYAETVSFSWERGAFSFKNGFGAKVPQSAQCATLDGAVIFLEMNGEVLIDR